MQLIMDDMNKDNYILIKMIIILFKLTILTISVS